MRLGIPIIVRDEQELLSWCLEGLLAIQEHIEIVSIVDNGSIDATPYIIELYKDRLPITVIFEASHHHHGDLRNLALGPCREHCDWFLYVDGDESFTKNMAQWLASERVEVADIWDFMKCTTIKDHLHHVPSGSGPTTRLFRNAPGVRYIEAVHTKPIAQDLKVKQMALDVFYFDHTALKSRRGLWNKGWRYQEHRGEIGIGPPHHYVGGVQNAYKREDVAELPQEVIKAGIIPPPVLDAHLHAILSSTVSPTSSFCWLRK